MSINSLTNLINQTVPYAWDNSLSMMEFLGKIVTSINQVIALVNEKLPEDFEQKFYNMFLTYTDAKMNEIIASGEFAEILDSMVVNFTPIRNEVIEARGGEITLGARVNGIVSDLAEIAPFTNKVIFASKYGFTNSTGDGEKLKSLIEGVTADILYIDTSIWIDVGIRFDLSKIKKIIGLGGKITLTNKGTSKTPYLKWENCNNMVFDGITFVGDFNRSLTNNTEWTNNIVSSIFLSLSDNVKIINCTFNNLIGASAILLRYCTNVLIKDNFIVDCWNNYDGDLQGDGIYVGFSDNIKVLNNYIKNNFTSNVTLGRVGITFEFEETKNCICSGNYIYGYDRAIHAERVGGSVLIRNNIAEGCAMSFIGWQNTDSEVLVEDNYFSNVEVPTDYIVTLGVPQRGFLSFYTNDVTLETNSNTNIKNNTFVLESNVASVQYFLLTKITGESYEDNTFIDKNRNKQLFLYNPNEVTINNNNLIFNNNKVECNSVYFAHIGKHQINTNMFNVSTFNFICTPLPTTHAFYRSFKENTVKNETNNVLGLVTTFENLFSGKVSLYCESNMFIDIKLISGKSDEIIKNAGLNYSATPYLKNIVDNNTLIITQTGTVTLLTNQSADNSIHPTITNKKVSNTGITYTSSGNSNKALIVTASDGTERVITVNDSGVLSATVVQRWK